MKITPSSTGSLEIRDETISSSSTSHPSESGEDIEGKILMYISLFILHYVFWVLTILESFGNEYFLHIC